jgi:L-fuculose-phosphate aldolase
LLSEVILTLGCVPLTGYGTPSTEELPQSLAPFIPHHDALLMANHGAVAYGPDLEPKITLVARIVGRPHELPPEAIEKLLDVRERAGYMSSGARGCQACGFSQGHSSTCAVGSATRSHGVNGDDTVTLTRKELTSLITEAARLVAREMKQ